MINNSEIDFKKITIGKNVKVWANTQIREGTIIGNNCIIGRNVYIDHDIKIGSNVKIQNNALIYYRSIIEDDVFVGPAAALINDKIPRATNPSGKLKSDKDWITGITMVKKGASLGAGAIILPNVTIGKYCLIGAGSVVTNSTPAYSKVVGNPARIIGYVCKLGHNLNFKSATLKNRKAFCEQCQKSYTIKK